MADTTPTLREAAQQFVQDYENGDLGDLKHYARSMRAALAEQASEQAEQGLADKWRALALQFDRHRMAALSHLRTLLDNPQAHAAAARAFLGEPPPPAPAAEQAEPVAYRTDGMPASASERYLRRLLAYRTGILGAYYDDGEAQGQEHGISIDFMREPVADIDTKLRALNVARASFAAPPAPAPAEQAPIDMVLHCPACGEQHIDAPEWADGGYFDTMKNRQTWSNPPHRSHLCHGCGHIWRPADVPTNGVAAIKTKGKADSPPAPARQEPLFLLHTGQIDSGGEQDEWDIEANSWVSVEEFCRAHPGQTIGLNPQPLPAAPITAAPAEGGAA